MPVFTIGGFSHIIALLILFLLGTIIIYTGKRKELTTHQQPSSISKILASLCIAGVIFSLATSLFLEPGIPWKEKLPLHFCDIMAVCSSYSLIHNAKKIRAITFFCVLSASLQALITPDLHHNFPSLLYYSFFLSHGITIISAFYIYISLGWRPEKYDFFTAYIFGCCYLVIIHPINMVLDTNFGFTRFLPGQNSVLSLLGEWPYYLFNMQIPAILFLAALNHILFKFKNNHTT